MTLRGIDVSKWQTATPSLAGLDFLIARASIGTTTDPMYAKHIANARAKGLVVGAYHFGYTEVPMASQVDTFVRAAGDVDLYAIDVEGTHAPTPSQTRQFIAGMHARGKRCGLYHSLSGFFDVGQDFDWVAKWSSTPPAKYDIWQYRGSPLDLDRFEGTRAELLRLGIPPGPDSGVNTMQLVTGTIYTRGIKVSGGHGIFSEAVQDSSFLIRNTVEDEVLPLLGNDNGFQLVDPDGKGGTAGYVANRVVKDFVAIPLPVPPPADCSTQVAAAVTPLHLEIAKTKGELTLANSRITRIKAETATFAADVAAS
jgi:hypothetical protein